MKNLCKKCTSLLVGLCSLFGLTCCQNTVQESKENKTPEVTGTVTVTAFDVGKADAMVVQTENNVTVIDTGCKGDGKKIEKFLEAQNIDSIDTLIITHFDKDHVGGAARLLNRMKIGQIYTPNYITDTEEYQNFIDKADEMNLEIHALPLRDMVEWQADDAVFQLYAANAVFYGKDEENDFSLCLYMQHGSQKFLFTGDAEEARQKELMQLNLGTVDFMKYPYHGNYMPCTEQFLDAFQPRIAVVCCSRKEYADGYTVETLEKRGVQALYTNNGTVTVVSDGSSLSVEQSASK
ncbi:MAG: MBL fold metallo-hydrolase [Oscillospiraceae bacterium]|nr:MBL fold metallo-hydrolase [Oscillospiraceae bacterium]